MNLNIQEYKGIPFKLIERKDYTVCKAKRFVINGTNQNVWIPNKHLLEDGTVKEKEDLNYVFRNHGHQLFLAGITWSIPGIKISGDPMKNWKRKNREIIEV